MSRAFFVFFYPVICILVWSYLVSSHLVLSCLALPCLVLPCLVLSCLVSSCLVSSCLVLSCLAIYSDSTRVHDACCTILLSSIAFHPVFLALHYRYYRDIRIHVRALILPFFSTFPDPFPNFSFYLCISFFYFPILSFLSSFLTFPSPPFFSFLFTSQHGQKKGMDKKNNLLSNSKIIVDVREFRSSLPSLLHAAGEK